MKNFLSAKEFWKDALWFAAALLIFYFIYIIVEYWPNIVDGFYRGWDSQ